MVRAPALASRPIELEKLLHAPSARPDDERAVQVVELVAAGDVVGARRVLEEARQDGSLPDEMRAWEAVLAPARAKAAGTASGSGLEELESWRRDHHPEYGGLWVAFRNGAVIDKDESLVALRDRVVDQGDWRGTLVFKVGLEG